MKEKEYPQIEIMKISDKFMQHKRRRIEIYVLLAFYNHMYLTNFYEFLSNTEDKIKIVHAKQIFSTTVGNRTIFLKLKKKK